VGSPGGSVIEADETVTFTLKTTKAVIVTSGGDGSVPTLTLNDGEVATYAGPLGTTTGTLTFTYTVQSGHYVPDLEATTPNPNLPGGTTIEDLAGNEVDAGTFKTIDTGVQVVEPDLSAGDQKSLGTDLAAIAAGGSDGAPNIPYAVTLTGDVDLTSGATVSGLDGGSTFVFDGNHHILGGDGAHGLFFDTGGVTIQNLLVENAFVSVASGSIDSDVTLTSGGAEYVSAGGTDLGATVGSGGKQLVEIGGSASGVTVDGGQQVVYGTASGTTITGGGTGYLEVAGSSFGTMVEDGVLAVLGVIGGVTVGTDGADYVDAGGTASGTAVDGGNEYVETGGEADGTTVSGSGAAQSVCGFASGTTVEGGAYQYMDSGGTANSTNVVSGVQSIFGVANNTSVGSGGADYVQSGGTANATVVNGGNEFVEFGGTANGTTVSGGTQSVYGLASGTVLGSGGFQNVEAGGTAAATIIDSGGYEDALAGSVDSGATISGGTVEITSGAVESGTVTFAASTGLLKLDDSRHFGAQISGFGLSDQLDLTDIADDHGQATLAFSEAADNTSATIQVSDGTNTATVTLLGQYLTGQIRIAGGDGVHGTLITDPVVIAMTDPAPTGLVAPHHA
jgi:autotransporter passenger strand-loop-strand repeat protein